MYRAAALFCMERGIDLKDRAAVISALNEIKIDLVYKDGGQRIFLNGDDVTDKIRTQPVAEGSSEIAAIGAVRNKLVAMQRGVAASNNVVMDGRDIGTHVLPGARLKIYMDADAAIRAVRRVGELAEKGIEADYDAVLEEIIIRDRRDATREFSPLTVADGAVYLDTGRMTPDEVVKKIVGLYEGIV